MISLKITKKRLIALLIPLTYSMASLAQIKPSDTLIIKTKAGKIILVSDSLQKFHHIEANGLIKGALTSVKDSLSETEEQRKKRLWQERFTYIIKKNRAFRIVPTVGIGTIRDKFSPFLGLSLDFGPQRQDYYLKTGGGYSFINLAVNDSFTFEKEAKDYKTLHNVFIEASVGNRINNDNNHGRFSEFSAGVGYLLDRHGPYFGKDTYKVFLTVGLYRSFLKIKPEIYFTDTFKKAFPGITLKIF